MFTTKLLALLAIQNVAVAVTVVEYTKPTNPDECLSVKTSVGLMKVNEIRKLDGECIQAFCDEGGTIEYRGCGLVNLPTYCRVIPGNLSNPYPDCCYEIQC